MPRVVLIGILCLTAAMLALETLLPRLFAVYVGPSFVYFSISVALIGLGSGGVLVATLPERFARARLSSFAAAFAVGLLAAVGCIWAGGSVLNGVIDARFAEILASPAAQVNRSLPGSAAVPSMVFVLATGLVMAVPFLLCGLCLAVAFRRYHRSARTLYAADLVGAAVGCVVAVGALQMLPLGTAFVLVAALAGLGGWLVSLGERGPGRAPVVTFGVLGALLVASLTGGPPLSFSLHSYAHLRSYNETPLEEHDVRWSPLGRIARMSRDWSPSLNVEMRMRPKHFVGMDLGGHSIIETFSPENLEAIKHTSVFSDDVLEPFALPGQYLDVDDYLVLMAGNGQDLMRLYAWYGDDVTLRGVELNPVVYELGMHHPDAGLERFFALPNVEMNIDEGRAFVERSAASFDVIALSYSGATFASGTGTLASTPQFLFTAEAFETYLDKLSPGGVLVLAESTHGRGLPVSLRTFVVALRSVDPAAVAARHVLCYGLPGAPADFYHTIYHRDPLTDEQVQRAQAALARAGLELRYAPGRGIDSPVTRFFADQPPPPTAFAPLAADRVHTDEHPFYYYDLVWGGTGGYLLMGYLGTLVGAGVIAVLFLLVPLLVRRRQVRTGVPLAPISWRYHAAFGCLGAGFMLLEVGAIQRLELFLGNPTLSLVVILGLLLASAGVGSWLSGRVPSLSPKRSALGVVGYGLVVMLFLNSLMYDLMALPLAVKVAVLVIVLAPLGMLMGAIFPALVARLGGSTPRYVPWALALNGVFSVLASNLGAVVYLVLGADVVLLMGIACYGVLTATAPRAVDIPSERGDADGPALPVEVPGSIELG